MNREKRKMKSKTIRKVTALMLAAMLMMMQVVPAAAAEWKENKMSHFGVAYTVDYAQGAVEVDGTRVHFGYSATSPRVRACGWKRAVELRAAEVADLVTVAPDWWEWMKTKYPSVEDYYRWKAAKR